VAFAAPKLCHVLPPASGMCGRVAIADIGIARRLLAPHARRLWQTEPADVAARLPARPLDSHKGDFGRVAILAGSRGKPGAAILAARGGLRGGAGLVTVFCAESIAAGIVSALPEAMVEPLPEANGFLSRAAADGLARAWRDFDAVVAGPGLGASSETVAALEAALRAARVPLVADADALNACRRPGFFAKRRAPTVLTLTPARPGGPAQVLARGAGGPPGRCPMPARASRAVVVSGRPQPDRNARRRDRRQPHGDAARDGRVGRRASGVIGALLAGGLSAGDAAVSGAGFMAPRDKAQR
jgi:NAD(P)H-hydrate epimerase